MSEKSESEARSRRDRLRSEQGMHCWCLGERFEGFEFGGNGNKAGFGVVGFEIRQCFDDDIFLSGFLFKQRERLAWLSEWVHRVYIA